MTFELKNKVVVITGSTRGIGESAAKAFAARGSIVIVSGRSEEDGERVAKECIALGASEKTCFIQCDVADNSQVSALFAKAKELGPLGVVIANAGFEGSSESAFVEYDVEAATKVINCNVLGYTHTMMNGLKALKEGGEGGVLMSTSSIAGFFGAAATALFPMDPTAVMIYSSTKAFNAHFVRYMRALGDTENIRVYGLAASVYETKMGSSIGSSDKYWGKHLGIKSLDDFGKFNMLTQTTGHPDDIAKIFVACADGSTKHLTGSNILCDNDLTMPVDFLCAGLEATTLVMGTTPEKILDYKGEPAGFKTAEDVAAHVKKLHSSRS